ncbi:MAG: ATP-binding protein [Steroidobacteraceae bacterium]
MRSLFARIFLSFWLTMTLIITVSVGLALTVVWNRTMDAQQLDLRQRVAEAEHLLAIKGMAGLEQWAEEFRQEYPATDVFIVDSDGRQVLRDKDMPDFLQRRMQKMKDSGSLSGPARTIDPDADPFRSIPQITAPTGTVYNIFLTFKRYGQLAALGTPDVQLTMLALALAISGIICWYLARSVTRPVRRLQDSARALANGNLDARVGDEFASRHDELSLLARDFDQMADRLRGLIASKEGLMRDVSHELRTPLARLRLALGLARREGANLEREHDRIEREAERLDELISEILRLARLNAPQPDLNREQFDFAHLVGDIAEDARLEATAQGKRVSFDYPDVLTIQADEELLRSAIENVVRNAVRFTAVGTAVELSLTQQADVVTLVIRDHGPGVPEVELSRLFEPFYRVHRQARERDTGGYGLGLAITARVMAAHHGRIEASNAPEGGLIVTLSIPLNGAMANA